MRLAMTSNSERAVGFALLLACTPAPAADDEAGVTTSPSTGEELEEGESSTSTSTTDTTDTTDEEEDSFLFMFPDGGTDECACDMFAQDCPQGEKCVPYQQGDTWDCNICADVLGDHVAGEACSFDSMAGTDDCDATSWCFGSEEEGTCHAFCTGTADNPECAPGLQCMITNAYAISICVSPCDPVVQNCEQGAGCYWAGAIFGCTFTAPSNGSIGEPCDYFNSCAPGLHCTEDSLCSPFCELGLGDAPCDALPGTTCVPFFLEGEAPQGYEHVGLCVSP
jgi:hypothetical protein